MYMYYTITEDVLHCNNNFLHNIIITMIPD